MERDDRPRADCPHPDCTHRFPIRGDSPEGEYRCICLGCRVYLSWEADGPKLTLLANPTNR